MSVWLNGNKQSKQSDKTRDEITKSLLNWLIQQDQTLQKEIVSHATQSLDAEHGQKHTKKPSLLTKDSKFNASWPCLSDEEIKRLIKRKETVLVAWPRTKSKPHRAKIKTHKKMTQHVCSELTSN